MSLSHALLVITLLWAAIHAIHHLLSSKAQSLLPTTRHHQPTTHVTLTPLHLRISTTAYNTAHDHLAASLKRTPLASSLSHFYDAGTILCVLGMLTALLLLSLTTGLSALSLTRKLWTTPPSDSGLTKRSLVPNDTDAPWITPIIPGITVPLAHLPFILLSVFLSQIVHEAGHALAGALDTLPVLSAGASFTVLIPSAFVTFPSAALDALPSRTRARIIAAGPFHNLVFWCLLVFLGYLGLGSMLWGVGYKDVSSAGRVVISVDPGSPLHAYIPPGTLITALDDTPLGSDATTPDTWTFYLTNTGPSPDWSTTPGWCADTSNTTDTCCNPKSPSYSSSNSLACFTSTSTSFPTNTCLDPIPLLTSPPTSTTTTRCTSHNTCPTSQTCVHPARSAQLMRLTIHPPHSHSLNASVILWSGSHEEVFEEVHIGTLLPRTPHLPIWLPPQAHLFWEYLTLATLSLFFFNLLPLPHLDGSSFLKALLHFTFSPHDDEAFSRHQGEDEEYDLEFGLPRRGRGRDWSWGSCIWWEGFLLRSIPRCTMGLFVVCTLLGIINVAL